MAEATIVDIAVQRARSTPHRPAYRFVDRSLEQVEALSYGELEERVRALATGLCENSTPGARIALALPPGLDFVVALFATLRAGRSAVPASLPMGRSAAARERLRSILSDASPELLMAPRALAAVLAEDLPPGCRIVDPEALAERAPAYAVEPPTSADLALVQYTSGSTANPKGVMVRHASLNANLEAIRRRLQLDEHDRGVSWLPMHHDMGLVGGVLQPMYAGFPVTLMSPLDFVLRPARWLQAVSHFAATVSGGPPFALGMCVDRVAQDQLHGVDLSRWHVAFVGAERVPASLLDAFAERFAPWGMRREALRPCYGLAEATLMVSAVSAQAQRPVRAAAAGVGAGALAGCGAAIDGHELAIVDDAARPCAAGQVGEIWLRGPSVAAGYWGRPQESARVFQAQCEGRGPFLRTGDRGFVRDGELFVVGREKDVVIVRGKNHAPEDIEASVAGSHPLFAGARGAAFSVATLDGEQLVVVHEVARKRVGDDELAGLVDSAIEAVVLRHGIRPLAVIPVLPGAIPRTTSGKVQRAACRSLFEQKRLSSLWPPLCAGTEVRP